MLRIKKSDLLKRMYDARGLEATYLTDGQAREILESIKVYGYGRSPKGIVLSDKRV